MSNHPGVAGYLYLSYECEDCGSPIYRTPEEIEEQVNFCWLPLCNSCCLIRFPVGRKIQAPEYLRLQTTFKAWDRKVTQIQIELKKKGEEHERVAIEVGDGC